jgi:hypothetical protein
MNKFPFALIITLLIIGQTFGQSKMIVGQKHTIFVDIPKNWLQQQNDQLPFFIKPDRKDVSDETYMYVYGIDYTTDPELNGWIEGNNNYIAEKFKNVKIGVSTHLFDNIKVDDYLTGNYKTITYEYPNNRNEVILVIECKTSIITVVLSTKDTAELTEFLPSFIELSKSIRILGTTLKQE